jgi:hypothetical protein
MARMTRKLWLAQLRGEAAAVHWVMSRIQGRAAPAGRFTRDGKPIARDLTEEEGMEVFEEVVEASRATARLVDQLDTRLR